MRTSLLVANSGALSFTSLTLMLTRTLVSWWWPPAHRHTHTEHRAQSRAALLHRKSQSSSKVIKGRMTFVLESLWLLVCLYSNPFIMFAGRKANYEYFPTTLPVNQSATLPAICYFDCKNYRHEFEFVCHSVTVIPTLFFLTTLSFWCAIVANVMLCCRFERRKDGVGQTMMSKHQK